MERLALRYERVQFKTDLAALIKAGLVVMFIKMVSFFATFKYLSQHNLEESGLKLG